VLWVANYPLNVPFKIEMRNKMLHIRSNFKDFLLVAKACNVLGCQGVVCVKNTREFLLQFLFEQNDLVQRFD
jgi:hypothetical protein